MTKKLIVERSQQLGALAIRKFIKEAQGMLKTNRHAKGDWKLRFCIEKSFGTEKVL